MHFYRKYSFDSCWVFADTDRFTYSLRYDYEEHVWRLSTWSWYVDNLGRHIVDCKSTCKVPSARTAKHLADSYDEDTDCDLPLQAYVQRKLTAV